MRLAFSFIIVIIVVILLLKLGDVCERGTSNLKLSDVSEKNGEFSVFGASGYIGSVDFYQQGYPYVAVVKDGAGIGRAMLCPGKTSVIGTMQYLLPKDNILPRAICCLRRSNRQIKSCSAEILKICLRGGAYHGNEFCIS